MRNLTTKTPTPINYHVLSKIEQLACCAYQGTDLGLCDVMSAMVSGYFVESRGAIMPAVDAFLKSEVADEKLRAARSRRAAKAVTYGQYNVSELVETVGKIVRSEENWEATKVQGYRVKAVDFTSYRRAAVKKLVSKAYDDEAGKAVSAVSLGMMAAIGKVREQRVAILEKLVVGAISENNPKSEKQTLYQGVAKQLQEDEIAVFDAGFSLVEAVSAGISHCLIRLAKNCTFGKTPGKIPERTAAKGPSPIQYKAEIVRPLARQHGDKTLEASPPDEQLTLTAEDGHEIECHVWHSLYFLERQLKGVTNKQEKARLRRCPFKVIAVYDPTFEHPLLLGTPLIELTPAAMHRIYPERWPIEGIPQTAKYLLSGGGGRHFVHHPVAVQRLPALSLILGSLFKYVAATLPPMRTGFWDRLAKPTYGRLMRYLKKVGLPLSKQLFKKASSTVHLPVGYDAVRLAKA